MDLARLAAVTFSLLASAGVLFAQQAGPKPRVLAPVTVTQLTDIVQQLKSKRDAAAAEEIEQLLLTERLSTSKLAMLSGELPGVKSKSVLMEVADASAFLKPPIEEIPQKAVPTMTEQQQMMALVVDYLKKIIPKLPNLYARRLTTSFEDVWTPRGDKRAYIPRPLHSAGEFKAMVYYREGKEVVHAQGAEEHGLTTRGTFGPILSMVIIDAARSNTTKWSHWEEGPAGPTAVFQFQVPQTESHYQVSASGGLGMMGPSAYHGEIGINPNTGTILRLMLEADPGLGSAMERADIMVEYGAIAIGGKMYTCPVRSVAYSVGTSVTLEAALGMGVDQDAARLNDVVFDDYHVFRSEMRIIP